MMMIKKRIVNVEKPFSKFSEIYEDSVLNNIQKIQMYLSPEEQEDVENMINEYVLKVDQWHITRSYQYFSSFTESFSFSLINTKDRKHPIGSVRSRIYYQLPGICKYIDKSTQQEIKNKLLSFPPHTRQRLL